jgi:hypothetical protein
MQYSRFLVRESSIFFRFFILFLKNWFFLKTIDFFMIWKYHEIIFSFFYFSSDILYCTNYSYYDIVSEKRRLDPVGSGKSVKIVFVIEVFKVFFPFFDSFLWTVLNSIQYILISFNLIISQRYNIWYDTVWRTYAC